MAWRRRMPKYIWVNAGANNDLSPDGSNIDQPSIRPSASHLKAFSHEIPQPSMTKINLKITKIPFKSRGHLCTGTITVTDGLPDGFLAQRVNNVESLALSWRCHVTAWHFMRNYHRQMSQHTMDDMSTSQSLDTDVQRPFYSVAIVALLPFLNMGRERRWPRWIKKASLIGSKRLWSTWSSLVLSGNTPLPGPMGLLPDTQNCGLRMHRERRERFPCHRG